MSRSDEVFDVLILGGGPAGLSAALYLGRARRQAVVLDAGQPRHAASAGVHNFLTREGMAPAQLRAVAWAQLEPYATIQHQAQTSITTLSWEESARCWTAQSQDGRRWRGRALLLATGVIDEHPRIPGYEARWGRAIHHCPFCHGWELRDQPLAVLASGEPAAHMARMVRGWTKDVIVLTHGQALDEATAQALKAHQIPAYTSRVASLEGPSHELTHVVLEDGQRLERRGMFVVAPQRLPTVIGAMGLTLTEAGYVEVDMQQRASLPMVWAAGDLTSRYQQVVEAAAQGGRAGAMIHATLLMSEPPTGG